MVIFFGNILMTVLSIMLSKKQTNRIIKNARSASWATVIQTVLLGIFGLVVTTYMTSSIKKEIQEDARTH